MNDYEELAANLGEILSLCYSIPDRSSVNNITRFFLLELR